MSFVLGAMSVDSVTVVFRVKLVVGVIMIVGDIGWCVDIGH